MRRLLPVTLVLGLALLTAGCGSKKSPPPETTADWANGVCSAINTWTAAIKSAGDSLKSGNVSKSSLQSATNDMKSATDTLASDLKGLGKPNTPAGQQAKDAVDQLSSQLTTDSASIKQAVSGASGVSGFISAAATVTTTLTTMESQLTSTFTTLQKADVKGELKTAFEQSAACKQLSASG